MNETSSGHYQTGSEQRNLLLSFTFAIANIRTTMELGLVINERLKAFCHINDYLISTIDANTQTHGGFIYNPNASYLKRADFRQIMAMRFSLKDGLADNVLNSAEPVLYKIDVLGKRRDAPAYVSFWRSIGLVYVIGITLCVTGRPVGILWVSPERGHEVDNFGGNFLKGIVVQIAMALSNMLANERIETQLKEIERYKNIVKDERNFLQQQSVYVNTEEIIGAGPEMQQVFKRIEQVAYGDTTVLLLGETGTGKEVISRAIHNASPRKNRPLIKVNCAALPANLIESELFGHEKGSFSGALERRIGKFELANNGTLFLDEIGELPLDLQPKLLRALQEREIERVGSNSSIKLNVRIIAATNRDLLKEVSLGKFRVDLYYRLNVFPITLPPLRARLGDLLPLAEFFIRKFNKKINRNIEGLSKKAEQELLAYDWPGNVREMENVVERCVLMTSGGWIKTLQLAGSEHKKTSAISAIKTLEDNERDYISLVLERCNGKVSGNLGAASLLGLPVSTLNSKIAKLNIKKADKIFIRPTGIS